MLNADMVNANLRVSHTSISANFSAFGVDFCTSKLPLNIREDCALTNALVAARDESLLHFNAIEKIQILTVTQDISAILPQSREAPRQPPKMGPGGAARKLTWLYCNRPLKATALPA